MEEVTNDESTWTNPVPATQKEEKFFTNHYLPRWCNAFVYERWGGKTEVTLRTRDPFWKIRIDNITSDGRLHENKAATVYDDTQLWKYLLYLQENGGSLGYNFFRNPVGSPVGPRSKFASALKRAARKYDVGVNMLDYDWWEELQ